MSIPGLVTNQTKNTCDIHIYNITLYITLYIYTSIYYISISISISIYLYISYVKNVKISDVFFFSKNNQHQSTSITTRPLWHLVWARCPGETPLKSGPVVIWGGVHTRPGSHSPKKRWKNPPILNGLMMINDD